MKKIAKAAAALLCAALAGGCMEASVENLLEPPKLGGERGEIYNELIKTTGAGIKLKYPKSGDFRSAFVMQNIDSEEGDEALVFYESPSTEAGQSALRLKILDKIDGRWEGVYDLACAGSEVESVSFPEIGDLGVAILVRYTLFNQSERSFSLFRYENRVPVELLSSAYSGVEVFDIDSDGENELVTVNFDKTNQLSTAKIYKGGGGKTELSAQARLHGGAAEYLKVTKGEIAEGRAALFLDYSQGGGQSSTDVIYCRGSEPVCPPNDSIVRRTTGLVPEIYCADADGDGLIEIPVTEVFPGYESKPKQEQLLAVKWYNSELDALVEEHYGYYSAKNGFSVIFPERWREKVTAQEISPREVVFFIYDTLTALDAGQSVKLLRIKCADKDNKTELEKIEKMTVIGENESMKFGAELVLDARAGRLAVSEEELLSMFHVVVQ